VLAQPEDQYGDHKALGFAEEFLKRKHEKPFFLAVGMWHPHIPMYSPKNYWHLYPGRQSEAPGNTGTRFGRRSSYGQELCGLSAG
jgi:hypothetical protein